MIQIRAALETDLPAILEIYNDAIINTTAVYDYEPHTLEMRKQWFRIKEAQGYPVFVAEENGRVVGFSSIGPWRAWAAYKYSVENSIYVAADQRGKGIGKKLLEPLIEAAEQLELHAIIAGIDATNEVSINLHRSFGFTEAGQFKQVGYKFGRWLDLTFMQLLLKTPEQPVDG
ncbi:GNAT family N-acetyltransferase [Niastella populi]|uniref:GNAT family N-acetyltransferase n=1 Tax=Niastella populi TaxID=550983 RepID=A0A1V9G3H4_9BACT|nr:GNAT family N-acetyltransferase [Niastella populi]OQP65114.1 GNAT family N-acetyltransferase [Niastella populi]